jgi:hypothetical protein
VVDDQNRLIAGHRRLEALRRIGWTEIPVRTFGTLTEAERRLMELEENIRRKDLTEAERSVKIVEMAETAKAVAQEEAKNGEGETRPNFGQVSKPVQKPQDPSTTDIKDKEEQLRANLARNSKRGHPFEPGSYRDVEQRTGIPTSTIRRAEKHVAAIEAHPEVREEPHDVRQAGTLRSHK